MAAKKEDQLFIGIIVLSLLSVVLLVTSYLFFKYWSDEKTKSASLLADKNTADNAARAVQTESESLKTFMGFTANDGFADIETQFKADMDRYAGTLGESDKKYRRIIDVMFTENQKFAKDQAIDKEKIKALEGKLTAIEAGHAQQVAEYTAQLKKVEQDAASEREKFNVQRTGLTAKQQQLEQTLIAQRTKFEQDLAAANEKLAASQGELDKQQRTIDKQNEMLVQESPSMAVADGRVTWVNQANGTVWIDLGSADNLRRQVTFSVFDASDSDAGKSEKKGKIEVVRLLGDHMAEARVLEDDPRNPILSGDGVYSQVWNRGSQLHFALAGKIDTNGDGRSDIDVARDLIELNGGAVDAYADGEGKVEGEMSVTTRYLVLGEYPEGASDGAQRDAWNKLTGEANKLGVETITLIDFLNQMGYRGDDRTVGLGGKTRSEDFQPRPNPASSQLRPRTPYAVP